MTEILILIVLVLIAFTLGSINYKLGIIAAGFQHLPRLSLSLRNLDELELPVLSAAISEVSRAIDEAAQPIEYNRN